VSHVKSLNQSYSFDSRTGLATFEDGVKYSAAEMVHVAHTGGSDVDIRALHLIKKLFDGEIVVPGVNEPRKSVGSMYPTWQANRVYPSYEDLLLKLDKKPLPEKPRVYSFRRRLEDVKPDGEQKELTL
jgi:hypothetical protein